jgi:hypothetical protein
MEVSSSGPRPAADNRVIASSNLATSICSLNSVNRVLGYEPRSRRFESYRECQEDVRLAEGAVLKTVGCESLRGSIPLSSA